MTTWFTGASWTGRAVTSRATDSGLPRFVTAGARHTRVSLMRDAAAPGGERALAPSRPVAVPPADAPRRGLARARRLHTVHRRRGR